MHKLHSTLLRVAIAALVIAAIASGAVYLLWVNDRMDRDRKVIYWETYSVLGMRVYRSRIQSEDYGYETSDGEWMHNGPSRLWSRDGVLLLSLTNRNNYPVGDRTEWDENGVILRQDVFDAPDGRIEENGAYWFHNGHPAFGTTRIYENGELVSDVTYFDGVPVGTGGP